MKLLKDLQLKIRQFCEEHHLECSSEHRTLDLVSEVGEFSKEILKSTRPIKNRFYLKDFSKTGLRIYSRG